MYHSGSTNLCWQAPPTSATFCWLSVLRVLCTAGASAVPSSHMSCGSCCVCAPHHLQVSQGYDVMFYIVNAKNLPACDWWNGLADPYVIITAHVGGQQFQYK